MKKLTCLFISALLIVSLCACSHSNEKIQKPVKFYYCTNPEAYQSGSDVFLPEIREATGYSDNISLLNLYLSGPVSDDLISPFPAGVTVESFTIKDITAKICLNSQFAKLSGLDLTLACAGLSLTIFELTDVQQVEFCVSNALLDGRETILLSRDDFLFNDNSMITSSSE